MLANFEQLNWITVLAATGAGFIFGSLYYTLLRKPWMTALGKTEEEVQANMSKGTFIRAIIGQFILAVALSLLTFGAQDLGSILGVAGLVWFGAVMTTMAINHGFQGRPNALTVIDGGHWLGVFAIQGLVLSFL